MSVQEELIKLGFNQLPEFDPEYFKYRNRVGFMLLLNEKLKRYYQLSTINAYEYLRSAKRIVEGGKGTQSIDLRDTLKESKLEDWVIYFRPHGLYPGLRDELDKLLVDYPTLNTARPRINPEGAAWVYQVFHEEFARLIAVTSDRKLTDDEVVGMFLRKWRDSLEESLKRHELGLARYYAGQRQFAQANRQWSRNEFKNFSIVEIEKMAGKPRQEVRRYIGPQNAKVTRVYHQTLNT